MEVVKKTRKFFVAFLSLSVCAVCTNFISFASPYWIQSTVESHSQFENIGLWTACFNGYMRPGQYDKAYFGCCYIYYVEYDRIRDWINPVWFYAIQVLSSCGMLVHSLILFVVLCQTTNAIKRDHLQVAKFTLVGHFFVCITLAASLVAFAIARYDSTWMPFPQFNVLSWSYAVALVSFLFTLAAFLVGFIRYMYLDALADEYHTALLQQQAQMGISSPPTQSQAPYQTYDNDDGRYFIHDPFQMRPNEDPAEAEIIDEEAANADFEEAEFEPTGTESNFSGLDPRHSAGSPYGDERRPMLHHPRT